MSMGGNSSSEGSMEGLGAMMLSFTALAQSTRPYLSFGSKVAASAAGCQPAPIFITSLAGPDLVGSPVPATTPFVSMYNMLFGSFGSNAGDGAFSFAFAGSLAGSVALAGAFSFAFKGSAAIICVTSLGIRPMLIAKTIARIVMGINFII